MPEHLIFDYVAALPRSAAARPADRVGRHPRARSWPPACRRNRRPVRTSRDNGHPVPGQRPGPPGQRPGPPGPPGQRSGPPNPPYGPGGRGPGGPGGYPPQSGGDGGPFGSRRNLILAIVGGVVLVGAAIGIGFWLARPDTTATPPPVGQVSAAARLGVGGAELPPPSTPSGSASPSPSPSASGGSTAPDALPAGPPLAPNLIVVPMRTDDEDEDNASALPGRRGRRRHAAEAGRAGRQAGESHAAEGPDLDHLPGGRHAARDGLGRQGRSAISPTGSRPAATTWPAPAGARPTRRPW